jgi:EpsI family protein
MPQTSRARVWCLAFTAIMLAGTLTATKVVGQRKPQPLVHPLTSIPMQIGGWAGAPAEDLSEEVQGVLKATSTLSRVYQRGPSAVQLFIAFYAEQRAGESMHSPTVCLPANGWEISAYATQPVPVGTERYTVNRYVVQKGLDRLTVLYWYQSRSEIVANEYYGKMLLIRNAVLKGDTAGSIVRLTFQDRPDAIPDAVGFASRVIPEVRKCFGG